MRLRKEDRRRVIGQFRTLNLESKKAVLTAAIFLVFFALGWKIFIRADIRAFGNVKTEIANYAEKQAALKEIADLENRLRSYEPLLSKTRQADWIIETVSRLAAETGLSLVSATPQNFLGENTEFQKISLSVEAGGGYHNLGRFVEKIENYRPLIKIVNLRVSRANLQGASGNLQLTLSLAAYISVQGAVR